MKKALLLSLLSALMTAPHASAVKQVNVVTTFYPIQIMALNVTRNVPGVTVTNLTPPTTGCLHGYSLTGSDMEKLAGADILIANGAGMENFLDAIAARYPYLPILRTAEGMSLIEDAEGPNPHIWLSISRAIRQVRKIGKMMRRIDPANSDLYSINTEQYVAKLEALRARAQAALDPYRGSRIITMSNSFPYLAKEFGLRIAGVIQRKPGAEPGETELADTVALVKKGGIRAIFADTQYPADPAFAVSRDTGVRVYILDPAVTGPNDPDAYISTMQRNVRTLREALR